jgi:hypothetical protein
MVAPFIRVFVVTFHCPGSITLSAAAETVSTGNAQNNVIQNPLTSLNFTPQTPYADIAFAEST